jgi:long-subunit acyl-CoA synthetase (AMP-forming)
MSRTQGLLPSLLQQAASWQDEDFAQHSPRLLDQALSAWEDAGAGALPTAEWDLFLQLTRHPRFLTALPDHESRLRWSDLTFAIIEATHFDLGRLLDQRSGEMPDRVLFKDTKEGRAGDWTYKQIRRRVRTNAALFLKEGLPRDPAPPGCLEDGKPRVALLCENGVGGACCDLACLTHDIFVTPLNVHFNVENLVWICDRLDITTAVCDHPDRLEKLLAVRERCRRKFKIFTLTDSPLTGQDDIENLEERRSLLDRGEIGPLLENRPRMGMRDTATVMFTSGSTGMPKGVAFNQHNLVSKRFARAAALPEVGRDEVMLCFLPLFHTFGRYLEMLGTIFWGGTYVFASNPSAEALLSHFPEIRPTALISVPVRWVQIRDRVLALQEDPENPLDQSDAFRQVTGGRLAWGLSAAGYLDPKVFRFFHRNGVALCSGFGMTEGTGGLTMTPPEEYVENSVGKPLPGVAVRFGDEGELQIAGPYIARYLPAEGDPGCVRVEEPESDQHWLSTGDLFREIGGGHLEIVDRIKDIYKNNRGQTIAPRRVESLFEGVPGIKRTFLAGDGRSFNTLLIVPDDEDEVLRSLRTAEERHEYFQQIVTTANPKLASFERVVNFAVLDRDFSLEMKELTPKGSFRRKVIEENFARTIGELYQSNVQMLQVGPYKVRIPRWFYRDLGVLEDAIEVLDGALRNRETGLTLAVAPGENGRIRVGDLEYRLQGEVVDLGILTRQPLLWLANSQVMNFCPCKVGWDADLGPFTEQVSLPVRDTIEVPSALKGGPVDRQLDLVNTLCCRALFGDKRSALAAVVDLDDQLGHVGARQQEVIRHRLEALAYHPEMSVRCRAYQVLVLDQPVPDYLRFLPTFIESGASLPGRTELPVHQQGRHRTPPPAGLPAAPAHLPHPAAVAGRRENPPPLQGPFPAAGRLRPLPSRVLRHHPRGTGDLDHARGRPCSFGRGGEHPAEPERLARRIHAGGLHRQGPRGLAGEDRLPGGSEPRGSSAPAPGPGGHHLPQAVGEPGLRGRGFLSDRRGPGRHLGLAHHFPLRGFPLPGEHQHHHRQAFRFAGHHQTGHRPGRGAGDYLLVHRPARISLRHPHAAQLRLLPARTGRPVHGLPERPDGLGKDS